MLPSRDRKDDSLSRRGLGMTFMVNMFDSQKRSCQFKWESACHSHLTCQSVTLITLICTSFHSTLSPRILQVLPLNLFTAVICLCIGLLDMLSASSYSSNVWWGFLLFSQHTKCKCFPKLSLNDLFIRTSSNYYYLINCFVHKLSNLSKTQNDIFRLRLSVKN